MITVSRAEWNARPPTSTTPLTLSQVSLFIVHYSGASRDQTVRSIQDYCMDVKGHSDIDYNAIVKDGKHHVGRGWNAGGHTLNHNSISYGVCVVGQDGDATPEDMDCVREIYDMVCAKLGRQITKTDHRMVLGTSYTDCPGDELDTWVAAGMPHVTGDDMDQNETLIGDTGFAGRRVGDALADVENLRNWFVSAPGTKLPGAPGPGSVGALLLEAAQRPPVQPAPADAAALKAVLLDRDVLSAIAKAVTDEIGS